MRHILMLLVAGLLSAPVTATLAAPEAPFVADGEVVYQRGSAAFDATRVRGPRVNMALTQDGRWGGNLLQKDVLLQVTPGRISGAGVNLVVTRDATSLAVEGTVNGIRVRVKGTKDTFVARVGGNQVECKRAPDGTWFLAGGTSRLAALRLKGAADTLPDVPMPQWIFAVIGAL